jgi:hypothetical protein
MTVAGISVVLAAVSVVAASTFYSFQVRNQIRLRRTDLLVRLYSTWDTLDFQESFHKIYWAEFSDLDSMVEAVGGRHVGTYVFTFYDQIGVLLKRGLIDFDLVDDLIGHSALQMWEKVGPNLLEARARYEPKLYANFEFLYEEMKRQGLTRGDAERPR